MDSYSLIQKLSAFSSEALQNDSGAQKEARKLSRMLVSTLQHPVSEATELVFSPFVPIAARMAVGLNLFRFIAHSDEPINSERLAELSGGEALLIWRLLRLLGSVGYVHEVSPDAWVATPLTTAMAMDTVAAGQRFVYDFMVCSAIKGPQHLRETHQKNPSEPTNGFVQFAHGTAKPTFEYLVSLPDTLHDFNVFMGNTMGARSYWTEWYPVTDNLLQGADPGSKLLVDIGGGKGHDLQAFHDKFPTQRGLVLQDLPQALQMVTDETLDPSIERMPYDFFTEQPVKGARAYFMHHILHDWPDQFCLTILKNIHAAMKPEYSRLLIHELILPDERPTPFQCIFDMMMMSFNSGMERSRAQWTRLLDDAGFEVVAFRIDDEDSDGIVEAVPKK